MPLALSTGHEVGLGVTALVFILFALSSSFLFPRFRPDYPGKGLLAFIVIAFVFFFGMLTAVEVFGAEDTHHAEAAGRDDHRADDDRRDNDGAADGDSADLDAGDHDDDRRNPQRRRSRSARPSSRSRSRSTDLKAGEITFEVKNDGKIPHDLAIKGTSDKTELIPPGGTAELKVTLKAGKYELYCTVPGHEAAGMKLNITVS